MSKDKIKHKKKEPARGRQGKAEHKKPHQKKEKAIKQNKHRNKNK